MATYKNNWQFNSEQLLLLLHQFTTVIRRRRRRGGGGGGGGRGRSWRRRRRRRRKIIRRRKQQLAVIHLLFPVSCASSGRNGMERGNWRWYRRPYHNKMLPLLLAKSSVARITVFSQATKRVFNWQRWKTIKESAKNPIKNLSFIFSLTLTG